MQSSLSLSLPFSLRFPRAKKNHIFREGKRAMATPPFLFSFFFFCSLWKRQRNIRYTQTFGENGSALQQERRESDSDRVASPMSVGRARYLMCSLGRVIVISSERPGEPCETWRGSGDLRINLQPFQDKFGKTRSSSILALPLLRFLVFFKCFHSMMLTPGKPKGTGITMTWR